MERLELSEAVHCWKIQARRHSQSKIGHQALPLPGREPLSPSASRLRNASSEHAEYLSADVRGHLIRVGLNAPL